MQALDVFARRFADAVRSGLQQAEKISESSIKYAVISKEFTREKNFTEAEIIAKRAEFAAKLHRSDISDASLDVRNDAMCLCGADRLLEYIRSGRETEGGLIQSLRIGPVELLCAPFEIMHAIKRETIQKVSAEIPLVVSVANGYFGYASDNEQLKNANEYTTGIVPYMTGIPACSNVHNELVESFVEVDRLTAAE
jgi:hypothetical protein